MNRLRFGAVICAVLTSAACAHLARIDRQAQADGSYRVQCKQPLVRCLAAIEDVCEDGYEVLQAGEEKRFSGPREINEPQVTSEAVARCRPRGAWLGTEDKSKAAPAASGPSAFSPKAVPPTNCIPGATQACVGPGACRGGQQCLADGAAFGPCDCGGTPTETPVPPPPVEPDGGPPAPK